MSKHRTAFRAIPSVLSIPVKVSAFTAKLIGFRLPMERHFSGRDLLLTSGAALLVILSSLIKPLAGLRIPIHVVAMFVAAVPLCLQGYRLVCKKTIPMEETVWLLAAILAALIGEFPAAPLILIFSDLRFLIEGYSLLHREAAPDALAETGLRLRHAVEEADPEKSPERKLLASVSLAFFTGCLLLTLLFSLLALFHRSEYRLWLHRALVFLVLANPSSVLFSSLLTHFGALFSSAKVGILYAGDQIPEEFSHCKLFAFSKTGTVTDGNYMISELVPVGVSEENLLRIAAVAECRSEHPIAYAIKAAAGLQDGSGRDTGNERSARKRDQHVFLGASDLCWERWTVGGARHLVQYAYKKRLSHSCGIGRNLSGIHDAL